MIAYFNTPSAANPDIAVALERVARALGAERAAAKDKLTEAQFTEAMRRALVCGDFLRHVRVDNGGQCVTYEPFRERERLKARVAELEAELSRERDRPGF